MIWAPPPIGEVQRLFAPLAIPWWIAGGQAIDLFLGRATRPHEDLDIQILRGDETPIAQLGWELHTARDGALTPWSARDRAHAIWCRRAGGAWAFELLVADASDGRWVYRRDPRVSCAIEELGDVIDGIPVLRPEIQLLYKSKTIRAKDEADFCAVLPALDRRARTWLREALRDDHPWSARLR